MAANTPHYVDRCKQLEEGTGHDKFTALRLTITNYLSAFPTLAAATHLKDVHITSSICDEEIAKLCEEVLLHNTSLEKVTLHLCECSNQGAKHLAEVIAKTQNIQEMHLLLNGVDEQGAAHLAEALKSSCLCVFSIYATQLDLLDCTIGDTGAGYLAASLQSNTKLSSLGICQSQITNHGLENILASLRTNQNITFLDLHSNLIDKTGATVVGEFLTTNTTLRHLILDKNHSIGCDGAKEIALALCKNHTLDILSLRSCGIGKKGGERFATTLSQNTSLSCLDLCGNVSIGDNAVELISRGLRENKALCKLNLSSCGVGDEGCAHLADGLITNTTLTHLWLNKNHISDGGAMALSETLTKTRLVKNSVHDVTVRA